MEYIAYFGLGIALGIVILIASMFISSAIAGGIDFGSLQAVIAKGVVLLAIIQAVYLAPYGLWLAIPIWWIGLMLIFDLDFWEARLLVVVNWMLGLFVRLLLIGLLR